MPYASAVAGTPVVSMPVTRAPMGSMVRPAAQPWWQLGFCAPATPATIGTASGNKIPAPVGSYTLPGAISIGAPSPGTGYVLPTTSTTSSGYVMPASGRLMQVAPIEQAAPISMTEYNQLMNTNASPSTTTAVTAVGNEGQTLNTAAEQETSLGTQKSQKTKTSKKVKKGRLPCCA